MISRSRIDGSKVLDIFENFTRDRNLPKFKKEETSQHGVYTTITSTGFTSGSSSSFVLGDNVVIQNPRFGESSDNVSWGSSGETLNVGFKELKHKGWFKRLWHKVFAKKKINVNKVFLQIFESLEQLKEFKEREDYINKALEVASRNGQTALVEKIKGTRETHLLESQLLALGYIKVISEDQLVKFAYECERGLRLDWIKNFTRHIPTDVMEKKDRADKLKIFDNYVILHYDPENKHNQLTKEEVAKKKDPILFGVCENTRKLYYVGDWKDEFCDLTFDDLISKIGEENLKIKKEV